MRRPCEGGRIGSSAQGRAYNSAKDRSALVTSVVREDATKVTIDLRICPYIDAATISSLVTLSRAHPSGFEVIVAPVGAVHLIFEVCGFLNGGTFVRADNAIEDSDGARSLAVARTGH
jgi:anti-anti-sigma regulatory factor